jgi:hypothetical protein
MTTRRRTGHAGRPLTWKSTSSGNCKRSVTHPLRPCACGSSGCPACPLACLLNMLCAGQQCALASPHGGLAFCRVYVYPDSSTCNSERIFVLCVLPSLDSRVGCCLPVSRYLIICVKRKTKAIYSPCFVSQGAQFHEGIWASRVRLMPKYFRVAFKRTG